jgi:MFS transporter, UMF1 family
MGGVADYRKFLESGFGKKNMILTIILAPYRKRLLLIFAYIGSVSATLFLVLPSTSSVWYLSALLAICSNVAFGASVVAMNAYIPFLARSSPEVVQIGSRIHSLSLSPTNIESPEWTEPERTAAASDPLLPSGNQGISDENQLQKDYEAELSRATSRISSKGIALGYGAGILLLLLALVPVTLMHGSTFSLRLAIGLSGIWWAVFSVPAGIWLPSTEHTSKDDVWLDTNDVDPRHEPPNGGFFVEIASAWRRLGSMLRPKEIKRLRNTFQYLAAWFLLSDGALFPTSSSSIHSQVLTWNDLEGFTTITSTAILFGKTTLHMQPSALILVGVLTPTSGILGSLVWPVLQRRLGWSNLRVLVVLVLLASAIPAYGCLGFLLHGRTKFGGLTTQGEMFALAVYFGKLL